MSDNEEALKNYTNSMKELQQILFEQRQNNPSQFVSHWEADEKNIEEETEEDREKDPVTKFLWAAQTGNLKLIDEMLSDDPQLISGQDADGYTALHRSAYEGNIQTLKSLLMRGADINAVTNDGWTALHSSCFWGQVEITSLLFGWKGCEINAKTTGLQTPLHLAAQNATNLRLFQLLLMHPNVNASEMNQVGEKPVDIACRNAEFYEIFDVADDSINVL